MITIQIAYGKIPAELAPCVESVRAAWPDNEYRLIERPAIADPIERCIASDALRFQLARELGPDMLYADLDVTIVEPFAFEPGPHFAYRREQSACFMFYGLTGAFIDSLDNAMRRRGILGTTYGWPAKILRDIQAKRIPGASYIHSAYTHTKETCK